MSAENESPLRLPLAAESPLRAELFALYREVENEIARLGPVCQLSGRCCRFREYGHVLFVSTLEVQLLLSEAPPPQRPLDVGETCPWQDALGRCTAREARPLGCRVYFCEPAYAPQAPELSERFIGQLKRLADAHGLPWNYAPLHHHLHAECDRGRFAIDLSSIDPR